MFSERSAAQRIVLVDDDPNQIVLLNAALKEIGQVFFEQDAQSALSLIIKTRPDVILMDIEMPGMNGYEVLAQIKADVRLCDIPIIFITGHTSTEEQLHCLRAGAVDFITKPLEPEIVAARVRNQLAIRDRERRIREIGHHAEVTLSSIGDAVITTDDSGRVTFMNPVAEELTGIPLKKAQNRQIEEIMPLRIGGDGGPSHTNPVRIAMSGRRVVGMALNCQLQRQDGRWIGVEDSAAPLISESNEVVGSVIVFREMNEARAMALKMAHTLQYDQLTDLPNRFLFVEQLKNAITRSQKTGYKLGLIQLDINRFKLINEEHGYEFGDALLLKVAKSIQSQLHQEESLSRHNADQFMVLVPEIKSLSDLSTLGLAIQEQVMQLSRLHDELDDFSISMGVCVYPDDATDAQTMLIHADAAVLRAKSDPDFQGLCFFSEDMESQFLSRRERYRQIKSAIAHQGVMVLYQPQVDSMTGDVVAVEALMRLQCLDGRLMAPGEFIELAEETRLIIPLGEQMIKIALDQVKRWADAGTHIRMCINISPVQFLDAHFVAFMIEAIEERGINPAWVELEVTESLMMKNLDQVHSDMDSLRALGITISIDDFGTGFSSLSYLKNLPVDVLKIDKSFVDPLIEDENDDVLIRTVAALSQSLELISVAEGVETSFQARHLKTLGVTLLQGYYFSRPVPVDKLQTHYSI